ncbi:hypothetical protein QUA21_28025 [Microcoleus sp. Pol1B3]|uniref:hypothetical protein n=1 Tax=unclassified Microcoleus TaxID=2642155 RepID=UPI002FD0BD44
MTFKLKGKDASPSSLFNLNLPLLLESKHQRYGWVFPIFLKALASRYKDDERQSRLNDLYSKIQSCSNQPQVQYSPTYRRDQRLFNSLLEIDFEEQQEEVTNALRLQQSLKRAAAFLVHGDEKCGQETLVHRLSQLSELRNGRRIKIKLAGMGDVSDLWNAVAASLTSSNQVSYLSPDKVIPLVSECLQSQHLVFIFTEVHRTCIGFLPELIEQFWQPILDIVNLKETYLVMFLVDSKGKVCQSGMPLAWQVCHQEYPTVPLHLPPTTKFLQGKISQWLRMAIAAEVVPDHLSVETLLNESQGGVPELVYQRICYYCGCSWEGGLAQWLIQ